MAMPKNGGKPVALPLKSGSEAVARDVVMRVKRRAMSLAVVVPGAVPDCATEDNAGKAIVWPGKIEATLLEFSKELPVGMKSPFETIGNRCRTFKVTDIWALSFTWP